MKIYENLAQITGKTPLYRLKNYAKNNGLNAEILAKLEYLNPAGSVKDRAVLSMLAAAGERGEITEKTTVIEPTSGNTGIAIAAFCAAKGLRAVIVMPANFSGERRKLIAAYGAETVLTDAKNGMRGAIVEAENLRRKIPNGIILGQFENPANPAAHYKTTAPEIWEETDGKLDIFVAGAGTGGTVSGAGRFFKEKNPLIKVFAAEPEKSAVLSGGGAGAHEIQGIGAGFVPENLDKSVLDGVIKVSDGDALNTAKELAKTEGIFAGISSGAALFAAKTLAELPEIAGKSIVTIFPDGGERYLSVL